MEKRLLYGLVLIMLTYLVDSGFSQGELKWIGEEADWEKILYETQKPILLTLTSSLCGVPCAILEDQVTQLAKTYGNQIIFYRADVLEMPFFARLYKPLSFPTYMILKNMEGISMHLEKITIHDLKEILLSSLPCPSDSAPPPSDSTFAGTSTILWEVRGMSDEAEWKETVVEATVPIVVAVTSSLCGVPCAILEDQMARLAKTYADQITLYKVNVLEKPFFAKLYKVLNVPTLIVFRDGQVIIRYEQISNWATIYDLIFQSRIIFDSALSPSPSPSDSAPPPHSGE